MTQPQPPDDDVADVETPEQQGDPAALEDPGKAALSAERRARGKAEKQAKELQARLDAIETERLSKEEKASKEAADAKAEAAQAKAEATRWRIAARFGMSDEDAELFLTGNDEETLTRQAQRFTQLAPRSGKGNVVPGVGQSPTQPPTLADQIRAAQQAGNRQQVMSLKAQQLAELANKQR